MSTLPSQFDLQVRRAREKTSSSDQVQHCVGLLFGLSEWYFINHGSITHPQPACVEIENQLHIVVCSSLDKIESIFHRSDANSHNDQSSSYISIPTEQAWPWCCDLRHKGIEGIFVNPGSDAFALPLQILSDFGSQWEKDGGRKAIGHWIPTMTTKEEDFWQEVGGD